MSKTISKNPEIMPKIFLEPREKRAQTTQPLNLTENPVFNSLSDTKVSRSTCTNFNSGISANANFNSGISANANFNSGTSANANSGTGKSSSSTKSYCMARVATNNQCGRNRREDSDYCGCHVKHMPYGRFDGPVEGKKFLNVPKKRGPRFKGKKDYTLEELDQDLYTKTQLVQVDNQQCLIDNLGILYTNDNNCEIIGRKEGDTISWFV